MEAIKKGSPKWKVGNIPKSRITRAMASGDINQISKMWTRQDGCSVQLIICGCACVLGVGEELSFKENHYEENSKLKN